MNQDPIQIIQLSSVDSTNNFAANLVQNETGRDNMVIMAEFQSKGKGQRSNSWESNRGLNLTFSLIKKFDNLSVSHQCKLNWAVSIAIVRFLQTLSIPAKVKWPNDIVINSSKIAGILIENLIQGSKIKHSIIGVGLNVNQGDFNIHSATSIFIETSKKYNLLELINKLVPSIIEHLTYSNFHLLKEYNSMLYLKNEMSLFEDKMGIFQGEILETDENGALIVKLKSNSIRNYYQKEIIYRNSL